MTEEEALERVERKRNMDPDTLDSCDGECQVLASSLRAWKARAEKAENRLTNPMISDIEYANLQARLEKAEVEMQRLRLMTLSCVLSR